ncbi:hypothetical protein CWI75_03355 [Kineobactrum sediminis]|uniref:Uncharacterized protein n=1 Tax=Kineobactrum sediminis TaxID=1905677 RepID=A0A2N5Y7M5_9GAMM|nr:hypothetical protein CWI75_03355 [Kineobactrum sediminis]
MLRVLWAECAPYLVVHSLFYHQIWAVGEFITAPANSAVKPYKIGISVFFSAGFRYNPRALNCGSWSQAGGNS